MLGNRTILEAAPGHMKCDAEVRSTGSPVVQIAWFIARPKNSEAGVLRFQRLINIEMSKLKHILLPANKHRITVSESI